MIGEGIAVQTSAGRHDRAISNALLAASAGKGAGEDKIQKVATDFEVLFISQMLGPMFGESLGESFFGSKESSDVYKSLMVEEYSKQIVQSGGIGVADHVKQELLRLQEI